MKPTSVLRALVPSLLLGSAACTDRVNAPYTETASLAIVNSTFQYQDAANVAARTTPRAIDVLVDSTSSAPGALNIPATSVYQVAGASSSYTELPNGIHSFVARLAGQTASSWHLFTNLTTNTPYLPQQFLAPNMPYVLVVAGIAPAAATAGTAQPPIPGTAFTFSAVVGDPFPPQQVSGAYQARFRVINAAPFSVATGTGATVNTYLTPAGTTPTTLTGLTQLGGALYRNGSSYFNVAPGNYVLTIGAGTTIVAQGPVALGAGEVRSFVVQSTGYSATPGPANHKITPVLDAKY